MSTVVVSGTSSGHGTCLNTIQRTNSSAEAAPGSANQRRVLPDSSRPPPRPVQLVCIWSSATINSELQLKFATILQILHAWLRPAAGFPTRIARIWEFIWTEEMSFIYKPKCYLRYLTILKSISACISLRESNKVQSLERSKWLLQILIRATGKMEISVLWALSIMHRIPCSSGECIRAGKKTSRKDFS